MIGRKLLFPIPRYTKGDVLCLKELIDCARRRLRKADLERVTRIELA